MSGDDLRRRALAELASRTPTPPAAHGIDGADGASGVDGAVASEAQWRQAVHELRVHQVELEMQNEELRRMQAQLQASHQRWFELYDLAPVGYCTLNAEGLIVQANLAAAQLLAQPRGQLAGRPLSAFVDPDHQAHWHSLLRQQAGTDDGQTCELRMAAAAGPGRWLQLSASATTDDQGLRMLRIVLVDVTARRQAEAAEAALHLARQASRHRSEFLSRVSHELRTPLNAILGFSHILLRNPELAQLERPREQLQHIHNAGSHLLEMVSDLLDNSRAATGQLSLRITNVDVMALALEVAQTLAPQADEAGVRIELQQNQEPGAGVAIVRADDTRLRQVMLNLLTNAIKYNRSGGCVTASVSRHGEYWRFHVLDNGLGMTLQQQQGLFQPFNRLGREPDDPGSTGLGLVIARDLVQAMGGQLTLSSEAGVGSEFRVDLLAADSACQATGEAEEGALEARADIAGRVLCAEEDSVSQALIRSLLALRPGLEVEVVASGAACIAAARRAWPALLILDQRLPDMPGLNVLKVLRQLNPHRALPCIVVSTDAAPEDIAEANKAGANDFLPKPLDLQRLLSRLDELIADPSARRPSHP